MKTSNGSFLGTLGLVPVLVLVGIGFVSAEDSKSQMPEKTQASNLTNNTNGTTNLAPQKAPTVDAKSGAAAFVNIAQVLQHPRCMNCHPTGDRPLQTDESRPHAMNISRKSEAAGLECSACHATQNSDEIGIVGGPPGAPNWHLPPEDTPMIFEGLTPTQLCEQLKRPKDTGGKDLAALLEHVSHDALVLWGWNPGGDRTKPPLSHEQFVAAFQTWVDSGGACP